MAIREVAKAFDEHVNNMIPFRFIDLHATPICLVDREHVKKKHSAFIESITEADIEEHTSYANQRREDVIRAIVKGIVKYAVLSHTWSLREGDEFVHQDMVCQDSVRDGLGWSKLITFVGLARDRFKCQFAWADTVCIDPKNPNDRQETARSCFDWSRNAYICIVYLAHTRTLSELESDRWFRRGWPLIELLAPIRIKFYGTGWAPLNIECPEAENDKADVNFLRTLSNASGICIDDLRSFLPGPNRVREKISWAAERDTTKVEDKAYSLISIFVSRMEIKPKEGDNAFLRLMLHIIPRSRECDVFAWAGPRAQDHPAIPSSPACYGPEHRDREFHPHLHHYRLRGDRSFSLGYDHLKIKVVLIDVIVEKARGAGYMIRSRSHKGFVNKIEPLPSNALMGVQTAIGVIDYVWTDDPSQGELREGECYFGFLLQRRFDLSRWEKIDTEKVVFLENKETRNYVLHVLHLLC